MGEQMEQVVAAFYKSSRERIQVTLTNYKGHDLLDLRIYWTKDGEDWFPSKKGLAVTIEKLPLLLGALQKAGELVGQAQPELIEDDILTITERSKLGNM